MDLSQILNPHPDHLPVSSPGLLGTGPEFNTFSNSAHNALPVDPEGGTRINVNRVLENRSPKEREAKTKKPHGSSLRHQGMDPDFTTSSDSTHSTPPPYPRGGTRIHFDTVTANQSLMKRDPKTNKPYSRESSETRSSLQILPCRVSNCEELLHGLDNLEEHLKTTHSISGSRQRKYRCTHPECDIPSNTNRFTELGAKNHGLHSHGLHYTADDLKREKLSCPWGGCKESVIGTSLLRHVLTHSNVK